MNFAIVGNGEYRQKIQKGPETCWETGPFEVHIPLWFYDRLTSTPVSLTIQIPWLAREMSHAYI